MPVKNIKRKTNDGLQGIIVGLTDEEKQALIKDGVGKSVSPCLNLMNMENGSVRTSITEEEKTNLEKGLYNSIICADLSDDTAALSMYFPETMVNIMPGHTFFSAYNLSPDETTGGVTITGTSVFSITVNEEKNTDGTYPISIKPTFDGTFGSGVSVTIRRW